MTAKTAKFVTHKVEPVANGNGATVTVVVDGPDQWDVFNTAATAAEEAFQNRLRAARDKARTGPLAAVVNTARDHVEQHEKIIDELRSARVKLTREIGTCLKSPETWGRREAATKEAEEIDARLTRLSQRTPVLAETLAEAEATVNASIRAAVMAEALKAEQEANREHQAAAAAFAGVMAAAAQRYVIACRVCRIANRGPVAAEPILREIGIDAATGGGGAAPAAESKPTGPVHRYHGPDGTVTLKPGDKIDEGKLVRGVSPAKATGADEYAKAGQCRVQCDVTVHGLPGQPTVKLTKGQLVNARDLPGADALIANGVLGPIADA